MIQIIINRDKNVQHRSFYTVYFDYCFAFDFIFDVQIDYTAYFCQNLNTFPKTFFWNHDCYYTVAAYNCSKIDTNS